MEISFQLTGLALLLVAFLFAGRGVASEPENSPVTSESPHDLERKHRTNTDPSVGADQANESLQQTQAEKGQDARDDDSSAGESKQQGPAPILQPRPPQIESAAAKAWKQMQQQNTYFNGEASLVELAERGDSEAQVLVGVLHAVGLGRAQDTARALVHYNFAAMQASNLASRQQGHLALGHRTLYGFDVPKDCNQASVYYQQLATQAVQKLLQHGRPPLGEAVVLGDAQSAPQPVEEALEYHANAASMGDSRSNLVMGQLHFFGDEGIPQDFPRAAEHFERAAMAGEPSAAGSLGLMHLQGTGVPQDNTTALKWLEVGAAKNDPVALNGLGYMYLHGMGIAINHSQAVHHFELAAKQNSHEAMFNLGSLYYDGLGVTRDHKKAAEYFRRCSKEHPLAAYNLGVMELAAGNTCGSAKFLKQVADLYADCTQQGHMHAKAGRMWPALLDYLVCAELGVELALSNAAYIVEAKLAEWPEELEKRGLGSEQMALRLYKMASAEGNAEAATRAGELVWHGGGKVSEEIAKSYFQHALTLLNNHSRALFNLGTMHLQGWQTSGDEKELQLARDMLSKATEAPWPLNMPALIYMAYTEVLRLFYFVI